MKPQLPFLLIFSPVLSAQKPDPSVYKSAGNAPDVIPDEAAAWIWIRDSKRSGMAETSDQIMDIAKGAALKGRLQFRCNNSVILPITGAVIKN